MTDESVSAEAPPTQQNGEQRRTFEVDPSASEVRFRGKAFGLKWVYGTLPVVSGTVIVDSDKLVASGDLATAKVRTGIAARDWHLRTKHYLHSRVHPLISVHVENIPTGNPRGPVDVSVMVRGTTAKLPLAVTSLAVDDASLEVVASGQIDRTVYPMLPPWCGVSRLIDIDVRVFARRSS